MKYYITYRITHPQYTPTTATGVVRARGFQKLKKPIQARGIKKWKTQDYAVEILKRICQHRRFSTHSRRRNTLTE